MSNRACRTFVPRGDIENETFYCGTLVVPQDWNQTRARRLRIAFAVLHSRSDNPAPDPILFLSGGPGNSALHPEAFVELVERFEPLRSNRDIILFDQRGVGASTPSFLCNQSQVDDKTLRSYFEPRIGRSLTHTDMPTARCVKGFVERGVDLEQFNTHANAQDTMALMNALGYKHYNLYGISYGTRLAMAIMHYFPHTPLIRSIVMDSVFPLPEPSYNEFIADNYTQQTALFGRVFDLCAADSECDAEYPDLRARFDALAVRLDHFPMNLPDGSELDREGLIRAVFPYNEAVSHIPYEPRLIAELERGQTATLMFLRSGTISPQPGAAIFRTNHGIEAVYDGFLSCIENVRDVNPVLEELRQMYDAEIPVIVGFVRATCTPEQAAQMIPVIRKFNVGDFNRVVRSLYTASFSGSANNLRQNILCHEEWPYAEPRAEFDASLRASGLPSFVINEALTAHARGGHVCPIWGSDPATATPTPESFGSYPTLLLNGEFDFITYWPWAQEAASRIKAGHFVLLPNTMHSILSNYGSCPTQITSAFLAEPAVEPDSSCTAEMNVRFIASGAELPSG